MGALLQDLRYALRSLSRNPGFTAAAVSILALGIGANTIVFSLVNAVLLRPLNFSDPDRLVWVWGTRVDRDKAFFSIPNFEDTRDQNQSMQELAAFANWGANLTGHSDARRLQGIRLTANAFDMLGTRAFAGRLLTPDDDRPESDRVVVLSYKLWQQQFGGSLAIIGDTLNLNGDLYIAIGVLPPDFAIPNAEIDLATALKAKTDSHRGERGSNFLRLFGRLKPGITVSQARSDIAEITDRLREQFPNENAKMTAPNVLLMLDEFVGAHRSRLELLFASVFFVLLIACANLANLLLSRSTARKKEVVIRAALGASRARLVKQFLVESMVLAFAGGACGLALTLIVQDLLHGLLPSDLPRVNGNLVDARMLLFCLTVSVVSAFVFGLFPAFSGTRINLSESLKEGGRDSYHGSSNRFRQLLISIEVALCLSLLITAALLIRSLATVQRVQPGFDPTNLIAIRLSLPAIRYSHPTELVTFYQKLEGRLKELPGVRDLGAVNALPLSGMNVRTEYTIEGRPPMSQSEKPAAQNRWVTPGYLQVMGINLTEGREFTAHDDERGTRVVVIDESLARHFWPNGGALGNHLLIDFGNEKPINAEIIGVADNVKHVSLTDDPVDTLYLPLLQVTQGTVSFVANSLSLVARISGDAQSLQPSLKQEVQKVDSMVPISTARPMESYIASSLASRRFSFALTSTFAAVAVILAAIGIYAVVSYSVRQRTGEFGLRIALGAMPADVTRMVVIQGMKPALIGIIVGLALAAALTRAMESLLFGVSPTDPLTFVIVPLVLMIVVSLACYFPARRAVQVDPAVALRNG